MKTHNVQFPGSQDTTLTGLLDEPDEGTPVAAYAIFAHCFTCSKDLKIIRGIAQQLTAEGIALLRFDFTGLGHSEGEFAETTFTSNTRDLVEAAGFLNDQYHSPTLLIGHSLGGAAALVAAHEIETVKAVATIAAPAEPSHVKHLLKSADFDDDDTAEVSIAGRPFRIGRQLIEDLDEHNMNQHIGELRRPLLIFHSPVDRIVGIDNAEKIYKAARHPKSFVSLDDSDHLVSDTKTAGFLGHVLSAWAQFYVA